MFDLTDEDLAGEDKVQAVPEGEEGQALDASIDDTAKETEETGDEGEASDTGDEELTDVPEGDNEDGEDEGDDSDEGSDDSDSDSDEEEDVETAHYRSVYEHLYESGLIEIAEDTELDPSNKGIENVFRQGIEKAKSEGVSEYIRGLSDEARTVVEALEAGATMEDIQNGEFTPEQHDFSTVKLYEENGDPKEMNMIHLLEDQMFRQGYTMEEAQERALEIKEAGLLEKDAERAKRWLVDYQEKHKVENEQKLARMKEEKAAEEERAIAERRKEVSSLKEIAGFKVSQNDAEALYDYTYKRVGPKGETQYQLDIAKKDGAEMLPFYLAMKGFDVKSLSKGVKTKQAIKLRRELANGTDPSVKAKGKSMNGSSRGNVQKRDELDLSAFDSIIGF